MTSVGKIYRDFMAADNRASMVFTALVVFAFAQAALFSVTYLVLGERPQAGDYALLESEVQIAAENSKPIEIGSDKVVIQNASSFETQLAEAENADASAKAELNGRN